MWWFAGRVLVSTISGLEKSVVPVVGMMRNFYCWTLQQKEDASRAPNDGPDVKNETERTHTDDQVLPFGSPTGRQPLTRFPFQPHLRADLPRNLYS